MSFYQAGFGDRLEYELTFNDYNKIINATVADSSYVISNICLEFEFGNRFRTCTTNKTTVQRQIGDIVWLHLTTQKKIKDQVWHTVEYQTWMSQQEVWRVY